ncbi:MAG TPA: chromate efflux transporter [Burkholderiales bacterium]|nr:chromate efflux transporter [Burkholderiales bacterium]
MTVDPVSRRTGSPALVEVFGAFLKLGLTSFGGPIAHLGYFREEFVARRKWLDEKTYADLVALCQFLPGPASSQVGVAVGIARRGLLGGAAAWLGFTLPSAAALVLFAYGVLAFGNGLGSGWLHGLKVVTVSVVAQAVWAMSQNLLRGRAHTSIAVLAALGTLALPGSSGQLAVIAAAALAGWCLLPSATVAQSDAVRFPVSRRTGIVAWVLFFVLLAVLPAAAKISQTAWLQMFDSFYRSGALVFGGGHVVLPLLQAEVVPRGWVTNDAFLAGYGAAQAVPGPLFTFAAYLGAAMQPAPNDWLGAALCLVAIFLPAILLVVGALPFWQQLRRSAAAQSALAGVNAGVVGLLFAALYDPVWVSSIHSSGDFGLALAAFALLVVGRIAPWLVVALCALAGALLHYMG